jgi:hypothetical protein
VFGDVARVVPRHRRPALAALAAAASLVAGAPPASATPPRLPNLLTNGGFEHPRVAAGSSHPFASIPGWHLAFGPDIELQNHVAGEPAAGSQFAELDSDRSSGIFQRVRTEPGRLYRLQLFASARPGTSAAENVLVVRWHRRVVARIVLDGSGLTHTDWHAYAFKLRATGRRTRLELDDAGISDSVGTYVDAVKVTFWRGHPTAQPR